MNTVEEQMGRRWRGRRLDTGEDAYGNLVEVGTAVDGLLSWRCFLVDISAVQGKDVSGKWEVDPGSLGRCTGMTDIHGGARIYEGDRVRSVLDRAKVFTIRFGHHRSWCELDRGWETNLGFYAEKDGGGSYPIARLDEWAERIGGGEDER